MNFSVKDIFKLEVAPALGCTEPVAIALGAAAAVSLLPDRAFDSIELWVDPNVYKNGLAVLIPGTVGLSGLDMAAALGALGGDPKLRMEVLDTVDEKTGIQAKKLIAQGRVKVNLLKDMKGIYVRTTVKKGKNTAETIIQGLHDNIVSMSLNGVEITEIPFGSSGSQGGSEKNKFAELEEWLKKLPLGSLVEMIDQLDEEDFEFLEEGIQVNLRLARYGLKNGSGLGVGKTLERLVRQKLIKKDMITAARIMTSSAADARMGGIKLPAMSSGGSGNHGLTAILPIKAIEGFIKTDHKTLIEAVGLSHLVTAYIKAHTGRLSAICGCSVAAGSGATAGVAYLLGGDLNHISGAIRNLIGDLAGVICDGAKTGCALKLATAAGTAVQAALFSLQGVNVWSQDGIVGGTPEQTMKNIGTLTTQGMIETDRTILKIMMDNQFA
jgi:L-cysteine desulfidase